jgi:aryl-alcohol dehydrogenase-like predicted oxidoreductase
MAGSLTAFDILPYDRERGYTLIDSMRQIAAAPAASSAQVAISWLLTQPAISSILLGPERPRSSTTISDPPNSPSIQMPDFPS